jgi:hypothetical protein
VIFRPIPLSVQPSDRTRAIARIREDQQTLNRTRRIRHRLVAASGIPPTMGWSRGKAQCVLYVKRPPSMGARKKPGLTCYCAELTSSSCFTFLDPVADLISQYWDKPLNGKTFGGVTAHAKRKQKPEIHSASCSQSFKSLPINLHPVRV